MDEEGSRTLDEIFDFKELNEQLRKDAQEAKQRAEAAEKKNDELLERIRVLENKQASLETSFMERMKAELQARLLPCDVIC
ncbi:hypothetical protein L484_018555 [Morus notabilis]|uniref:Uncharacterized protein n=1 Tax=Morus notabilis TaxID=981085 RepID=W9QH00_9ROSA|nr:hypothetical protein L484_018555 [Morus notabilis]